MVLRDNEVMLRSYRASIFKHGIITILDVDDMSIAIPRTRRVEGRVHHIWKRASKTTLKLGLSLVT